VSTIGAQPMLDADCFQLCVDSLQISLAARAGFGVPQALLVLPAVPPIRTAAMQRVLHAHAPHATCVATLDLHPSSSAMRRRTSVDAFPRREAIIRLKISGR
jgi:hypothetical protein